MPIYSIAGPDGKTYEIEGPEGATREQVIAAIQARLQEQEQAEADRIIADAMRPDPGLIENLLSGAGAGAVGLFGSAARGGAALLDDETEQVARDYINRSQAALTPEGGDPEAFSYKLGSGIGSILGFIPAAFAGPAALPLAGALGVGAGAGEARDRAMEAGVVGDELGEKTLLGGAVGISEIFPLGRIFKALRINLPKNVEDAIPEEQKKDIKQWLLERLKTGGYEAAQEGGAAIAQNLIEQTYNPEQTALEGAGEQATIGGIAGALVDALLPGRARGPAEPDPVPETEPAAGETPVAEPTIEEAAAALRAARQKAAVAREDLRQRAALDNLAEQRAFEATQRVARGQLGDEQGDMFARELLDALEQSAPMAEDISDEMVLAMMAGSAAQADLEQAAEADTIAQQESQITIDEKIAAQRQDEAETREIEALIRADEQAAETQRIRDELARRQREQQVEEDWNLAEVNRAQEEVYGTEPESVAAMEAAIPEAQPAPPEQFPLPGVRGAKQARKAGATPPPASEPIMISVTNPETGEVTRETVPGEIDYEEYLSRERAVNSDMFDALGVNRNAGLRRQFQGRDLSDPQTRADLESAMNTFIQNPFSSKVSRDRIPEFLKALKVGFGDTEQLYMFGPNNGPTNEARNFGRDKPRPRPAQPEQPTQEASDAAAQAPTPPPVAEAVEPEPVVAAEPAPAGEGVAARPPEQGPAVAEAAPAPRPAEPEPEPVVEPAPPVQPTDVGEGEQRPSLRDPATRGKLKRLRRTQEVIQRDLNDAEAADDVEGVEAAQKELDEVLAEIAETKAALKKTEPKKAEAPATQADKKVTDFFKKIDYAPVFKSRELVIDMPVDTFLKLAESGYDTTKAKRVSSMIKEGKKFEDIPQLLTELRGNQLRVVGHEGRHRARALKELGYDTIPIKIRDSNLRWDQQTDPNLFDYLDVWPETVVSEDGKNAVSMFVDRQLRPLPIRPVPDITTTAAQDKPAAPVTPEPEATVAEAPAKEAPKTETAPETEAVDQQRFAESLGRPQTSIQPTDPVPADDKAKVAQLIGGKKTNGTPAETEAARIFFGRMERPIDAIREIAYELLHGKVPEKGKKIRERFEKGTPEEIKAFYRGKNMESAEQALSWVVKNLSSTSNRAAAQFQQEYETAAQRDAKISARLNNEIRANKKQKRGREARFNALMKKFRPLSQFDEQLTRAMQTLTNRRMILESLQAQNIDTSQAQKELDDYEARLEAAMALDPKDKYIDEDGNRVSKNRLIENILDEANALELSGDAVSASTVPLHPYVIQKLAENDLPGALKAVAFSHPDFRLAQIANGMADVIGDTQVKFKDNVAAEYGLAGFFDPNTNTITLDTEVGANTHALMHEVSHALTSATLDNPSHPMTRQLNKLYEDTKDYLGPIYAVRSLDEFVAESQSNPDFRRKLNQINFDGTKITAWQRLRNIIGNMLRRLAGLPSKEINTVADKIDYLVDEILAPAPMSRPAPILKLEYDEIAEEATRSPQTPAAAKSTMDKIFDSISPATKGKISQDTVNKVHEFFTATAPYSVKRTVLGLMSLYPVTQLATRYFPKSAPKFRELVRRYNGEVNNSFKYYGEGVIKLFKDWANANQEQYKKLSEVLIEGDTYGVDLTKPADRYKNNPEKKKAYADLMAKYEKLDEETQKQYKVVRATYDKLYEDILSQIKNKIDSISGDKELSTALYNEFYRKLTEKGGFDGYFPRQRQGDWILKYEVETPDGKETVFAMFDSRRARDRAAEIARADENTVGEVQTSKKFNMNLFSGESGVSSTFLGGVMNALNSKLDPNDQDAAQVKEQIMRLAVELSPQGSIARSLSSRKQEFIRGADTNVLGVFTESVMRLKRREINLRFNAEFYSLLNELKAESKEMGHYAQDSTHPGLLYEQEMRDRLRFAIDPSLPTWSHHLRTATYGMTLGLNPSSALIDMAAIPMVIHPMLAGQFKGQSATKAIFEATRLFTGSGRTQEVESALTADLEGAELEAMQKKLGINGRLIIEAAAFNSIDNINYEDPNLSPRIKRIETLNNVMKENGQIQRLSFFDDTDAIGESNTSAKINAYQGALMQASERARREVSAVAYYNMALDKAVSEGKEVTPELMREVALEAVDFIELTSGGTSSLATARYAQGKSGIGSVIMMYKRYGFNMIYLQTRLLHQSLRGESPKIREIARRQFGFMLAQSTLWAGAMGAPMMGIVAALFDMFADEGDDDFRTALQKSLVGMGGADFGKFAANGILDTVTGMSISQRVALTDMIMRYDPNAADLHPSQYVLQTFAGPTYGVADKMYRGLVKISEGDFQRGIEQILPTTVSNGFKAYRFYSEGAISAKGETIIEDFPPLSELGQLIGFAPAELTQAQRFITVQKIGDRKRSEARTKLFSKLYMAHRMGDVSEYVDLMREVYEHNMRYPDAQITQDDIDRSRKIREGIDKERILGAVPGDKARWEREAEDMGLFD